MACDNERKWITGGFADWLTWFKSRVLVDSVTVGRGFCVADVGDEVSFEVEFDRVPWLGV
eukprot:1189368-Amphidinium_carterae.1